MTSKQKVCCNFAPEIKTKENMKNVREYKKENSYYMYSKLKVPGVLVEAGFVSNPNDNYKIRQTTYQDILIKNITLGIEKYFNS